MAIDTSKRALDEVVEDFKTTAYRLVRPLAEGGMGSVFLAEHVKLERPVVIKLLLPTLAKHPQIVERLMVEGRVLANVVHENLVKVTDLNATVGGRVFIAMEHLTGSTLGELLEERGGFIPPLEAIELVVQVLQGLEAAHQAGVVHRDVKLDNVFVCAPDERGHRVVKVLDFGIAKVLSASLRGEAKFPTAEGTIMGTPLYMSPEQASAKQVDARSDVYSTGIVLFKMVTGRVPFVPARVLDVERAFLELLKMHVEAPPPVPSSVATQPIPLELDHAILKALAKRPEDRFASAQGFADALEAIARRIVAANAAPTHAPRFAPGTELMPRASRAENAAPVQVAGPAREVPVLSPDLATLRLRQAVGASKQRPRSRTGVFYVLVAVASAAIFTILLLQIVSWIQSR